MRVDATQVQGVFQVRVGHGEEHVWVLVSKGEDGSVQITIQEETLGEQGTSHHVLKDES